MVTTVTGKHQVTIPAKLAQELGIVSGSRLQWQLDPATGEVRIKVLPDRKTLANTLLGAGRKFLPQSLSNPPLPRPSP